jgi:DNA-binding HxlR family transcriptional regulator
LVVDALSSEPRKFGELQAAVPGIATNILADRLKRLEAEGVLIATVYSEHPPRFSYSLSSAGSELAGALRLLAEWGARRSGQSEALLHATCGTPVEARWYCPTCDRAVEESEATEIRFA